MRLGCLNKVLRAVTESCCPGREHSPNMAGKGELLVLENFIGGKFLPCNSYIDSHDPSTGELYCKVPNSGKEEVSLLTWETKMLLC